MKPDYPSLASGRNRKGENCRRRGAEDLKTLGLYLRDGGPTGSSSGRRRTFGSDVGCLRPVSACRSRCTSATPKHFSAHRPVQQAVLRGTRCCIRTGRSTARLSRASGNPCRARPGFCPHPKTTFVALHVGHWAENLEAVGECSMSYFHDVNVDIGARIGGLGRQPRTSRRLLDGAPDRRNISRHQGPAPNSTTPSRSSARTCLTSCPLPPRNRSRYLDYAPPPGTISSTARPLAESTVWACPPTRAAEGVPECGARIEQAAG